MFKKLLLVLGVVFLVARVCYPARPLKTDDAGTVEEGKFELEIGYDFVNNPNNDTGQSMYTSLATGLTDRVDFGIAVPYQIAPESGLDNAEIGLKFFLLKERAITPAISLTVGHNIGASEYALCGIASKEIGRFALHLNVGYNATGSVDEKGTITYSIGVEFSGDGKLVMVSEISGEENETIECFLGGRLQVSETIAFDLAGGLGLNEKSPDSSITLGSTLAF